MKKLPDARLAIPAIKRHMLTQERLDAIDKNNRDTAIGLAMMKIIAVTVIGAVIVSLVGWIGLVIAIMILFSSLP